MAAMRVNIPTIFVSGGPMEAGKYKAPTGQVIHLDLVDAMVKAVDSKVSDAELDEIERSACPTCGSCSGMFTANSMNCLTEAPLRPSRKRHAGRDSRRSQGVVRQGRSPDRRTRRRYYEHNDSSVLPRSIGSFEAFENAMTLDVT